MRIYDIGSNIGKFTEENIKKYPEADFILVEANPHLFQFLNKKFEGYNNIKVLNNCVSDSDNIDIVFFINESDTISTASIEWKEKSRFSNNYKYIDKVKCKSISIDKLIEIFGDSDYMKIDVEGYENTVIRGIKKYIGMLSFEWAEELKSEMIDSILYLNKIGYEKFHISYDDNYTFIPTEFENINDVLYKIDSLDEKRKQKWGMVFAK